MSSINKPLYSQIIECLKEKIHSGELLPGQQLPTEMDLAEQFSVSRITSKRAMEELEREGLIYRKKRSGSFVSPNTKSNDLQYKKSKVNIIALVMPHTTSMGRATDIIEGLTSLLSKNGYYLTIHISNEDVDQERQIINSLIADGVSGIILNPVSHIKNIDLINRLILDQIPLVTIDKYFEGLPTSSVLTDNFQGSYDAVSYLIDSGHKEIAFISDIGIGDSTTVRDRYLGYCKALKDYSLPIKDENFVQIDYLNNEILMEALRTGDKSWGQMLVSIKKTLENTKCTAIHTAHDYLAIYIMKVALEMGIKVPERLSLIGYDNIENCSYLEVPLTSIEYSFTTIGQKCAELLLERINNPMVEHKRVLIPTLLVHRDSVSKITTDTVTETTSELVFA